MTPKTYKTLFFGTPEFAVPVLKTLTALPYIKLEAVITQPDKPAGKKQIVTPPPVKVFAEKNHIKVFQPVTAKSKDFEQKIRDLNPDVVIVVAYGQLIPEKLLNIPKYGWLNVHASLLPKYRGASPIQTAILNGIKQTGVTLIKLDTGLDTGQIISQQRITIEPTDNSQTLHHKLSQLGAELVQETLLPYLAGKLKPQPQDNGQATTTKIIKKENGRINWNKSADFIERQIRAYTPWPGTFCYWHDKRLKILKAAVSNDHTKLNPGQTKKVNNSVLVGCGNRNLELMVIQLEGKKQQSMEIFLPGHPEFIQTRLT